MTLQGAIIELQVLMNQDDIPSYYKGTIQKVIETLQMDCVEVIKGKWKHRGGDEWFCTNCGYVISTEGSWEHPLSDRNKYYCEHCGADMRGDKDGCD